MALMAVAGEASGDALLAEVLGRLPGISAFGLGGERATAAGLALLMPTRALAASGLVEALSSVPAWLEARRRLWEALPRARTVLLVDFPELNLRLLKRAAAVGVPAFYLAPPQVYAWRAGRAKALQQAREVGCLFSFEVEYLRLQGVAARWVGHPLAGRPPLAASTAPGLALLPGSRDATVARLLPIMLTAAARLIHQAPGLGLHLAVAPTVDRLRLTRLVVASDLPVILHTSAAEALARSTVALAGAGTATLEAALLGRPVLTLARLHPVSAWVAQRAVRVRSVALPNLVLGRPVFPERLLEACTGCEVANAAARLLEAPEAFGADLAELRAKCLSLEGMDRFAQALQEAALASSTRSV